MRRWQRRRRKRKIRRRKEGKDVVKGRMTLHDASRGL